MAEAVMKVKRTKRVAMSRSILGFRLNTERGSRLGKERKKRKVFNMQNDVVYYFFSMCNPIQTKITCGTTQGMLAWSVKGHVGR